MVGICPPPGHVANPSRLTDCPDATRCLLVPATVGSRQPGQDEASRPPLPLEPKKAIPAAVPARPKAAATAAVVVHTLNARSVR